VLARLQRLRHIILMQSNFSLFRERLREACQIRNMTHDKLCSSIGIGGRRVVDLDTQGLRALDIHRLAQIADRLDVSIDWLVGRSDVMEPPQGKAPKVKSRA